jgi:hypothetical protein
VESITRETTQSAGVPVLDGVLGGALLGVAVSAGVDAGVPGGDDAGVAAGVSVALGEASSGMERRLNVVVVHVAPA